MGKSKKSMISKWWFWIIIFCILLIISSDSAKQGVKEGINDVISNTNISNTVVSNNIEKSSLSSEITNSTNEADNTIIYSNKNEMLENENTTIQNTSINSNITVEDSHNNSQKNTLEEDEVFEDTTNSDNIKTYSDSSTSSVTAMSTPIQDTNTDMVWVGDTGTKYHYQSCRTLKGNGHQITLQQALAEGREPCKVCH